MKKLFLFFAALCCTVVVWAITPHMADGATIQIGGSYMEENILLVGGVPELKQGAITYDPTNHVLTFTDVLIETTTTAVFGMGVGCADMAAGSKQMEIRLVGTNIIKSSKSGSYGLLLGDGTFTITGINGTLQIMTNSGTGLGVGAEELTIKDGAYVHAGYSDSGLQTKTGAMPVLANPIVTVDCATLLSFGTECSLKGINPSLIDAEEQDGYSYNSSTNEWTEDGTATLKNKSLRFAPTKHIFWCLNAVPEGGTIAVTKNGNPITSPYRYDDSEKNTDVDIVATPNEGWEFVKWNTFNGNVDNNAVPSTQYELPISQTGMVIGYFRKTSADAPTKPWYMVHNTANEVVEYSDLTKDPKQVADNIPNKTKVTQATFAEGKLYYLDQQNGTEVAFFSTAFDPSTGVSTSRDYVFTSQTTYQQFYALTYNPKDGYFYATAKKNDSKQYLLKISLTGNISVVGEIPNADMNNSVGIYLMAATKNGELYGIFKSGETHDKEKSPFRHGSMLCKIDASTAAITPIGWTGLYFESPSCAMAFDYKTNALIGSNDGGYDKCIFSIDSQTGRATRLAVFSSYNNGIFQMIPSTRKVTTTVKSGQDEMGTAVLLETGKTEGRVMIGDEFDIEAFPSTDYRFVKWSDGSTANPRTITMEESTPTTYTAEFDWAEDITPYPIRVGGKQMHSKRTVMTNANNTKIGSGSISYDASSNTLTLNDLSIEDDEYALLLGDENSSGEMKIVLVGDNYLTSYGSMGLYACLGVNHLNVRFEGEGTLKTNPYYSASGIILGAANLTFYGVTATIDGNSGGIFGIEGTEIVSVIGSNLKVQGLGNGSILNIGDLQLNHCQLTSPSGAAFNESTKQVEVSGSVTKSQLVFTPDPTLRAVAVEDGSATFTLSAGNESFENIGWFTNGTQVTVTASANSGYDFAYWTDDTKWNKLDDENHLGATREVTKNSSATQTVTAMCYYKPSSSADWFGWHSTNKFLSFNPSSDHALTVTKSSTNKTITAGDFDGSDWIILESGSLKRLPFSGITDGEPLVETWDNDHVIPLTCASLPASILDMAYNFQDGHMLAVTNASLYHMDYDNEQKAIELGKFQYESSPVSNITAVAVGGSGEIYVLASGTPTGILYKVTEIDTDGKKVTLEKVGENGEIKAPVTAGEQSMSFDHVTNEILWGATDYLRIIDPTTAESHIAGALNWSKSGQGVIKGLHRRDHKVTVKVEVAADSQDMGSVTVNGKKNQSSVFAGAKASLVATPAAGYKFAFWTKNTSETVVSEKAAYSPAVSAKTTFYAHFAKEEQGIEDVKVPETGAQKMLLDGNIYIIRDGAIYTITGERVK